MNQSLPIELLVQASQWERLDGLSRLTQTCIAACTQHIGKPMSGELSLALLDDAAIKALNRDYRGKDKPTNVLSFPSDGVNPAMGDIAFAYETIKREAAEKSIGMADHFCHLLVHGYLHLSGYDHITDTDAERMERIEVDILAGLGIANPYQPQKDVMQKVIPAQKAKHV